MGPFGPKVSLLLLSFDSFGSFSLPSTLSSKVEEETPERLSFLPPDVVVVAVVVVIVVAVLEADSSPLDPLLSLVLEVVVVVVVLELEEVVRDEPSLLDFSIWAELLLFEFDEEEAGWPIFAGDEEEVTDEDVTLDDPPLPEVVVVVAGVVADDEEEVAVVAPDFSFSSS